MHIYQYVCKTFLKELAISLKCRENFEKLLKCVMFLKILLFHRYNSAIFSEQSFQQVTLYYSNSGVFLIVTANERCRFLTQ